MVKSVLLEVNMRVCTCMLGTGEKTIMWYRSWKNNKKRKESVIFLVPNYNVGTVALLSRLSGDWNGMMGAKALPNSTQIPSFLLSALSVLLISPLSTKVTDRAPPPFIPALHHPSPGSHRQWQQEPLLTRCAVNHFH